MLARLAKHATLLINQEEGSKKNRITLKTVSVGDYVSADGHLHVFDHRDRAKAANGVWRIEVNGALIVIEISV